MDIQKEVGLLSTLLLNSNSTREEYKKALCKAIKIIRSQYVQNNKDFDIIISALSSLSGS